MTTASSERAQAWDVRLRQALRGSGSAGVETLHGARPPLLSAESAACVTSIILAAFVCGAALFRARLAGGQIDLIASALRVVAVAFIVRAGLGLVHLARSFWSDREATTCSLVLGPEGLLLHLGASERSARREDILDIVAPEPLPSRTLAPRPLPVMVVLTPQAGAPRVLHIPPYFAVTSEVLLARLKRWLGTPATPGKSAAPAPDDAPDAHYARAAAGQLALGDVVIPEGRGYLLRAPYAALLGLWFALDVYYSAGTSRALISAPVAGAGLLSLAAIVVWFVWLGRRRKSRLGIGMLLTQAELLLRGPHGVVAVPWPQLSQSEVHVSARWSPFVGTYAARVLSLTTQSGERMLFDASFLGTPVEVVSVLCKSKG